MKAKTILLIAAPLSLLLAGAGVFVWNKARAKTVASVLSEYHHAQVFLVSARAVSVAAVDSIALINASSRYNFYQRACKPLIALGVHESESSLFDSLNSSRTRLGAAIAKMPSPQPKTYPYTLCRYSVGGDTMSAVLNDSLRVIWRGRD